jgi:hypothetical protein
VFADILIGKRSPRNVCSRGARVAWALCTLERAGWDVVKVYKDHGISGAKGREKRPQFDALHRDANARQFDVVMAWSVDRLGRSLQDLVEFLTNLHALKSTGLLRVPTPLAAPAPVFKASAEMTTSPSTTTH